MAILRSRNIITSLVLISVVLVVLWLAPSPFAHTHEGLTKAEQKKLEADQKKLEADLAAAAMVLKNAEMNREKAKASYQAAEVALRKAKEVSSAKATAKAPGSISTSVIPQMIPQMMTSGGPAPPNIASAYVSPNETPKLKPKIEQGSSPPGSAEMQQRADAAIQREAEANAAMKRGAEEAARRVQLPAAAAPSNPPAPLLFLRPITGGNPLFAGL